MKLKKLTPELVQGITEAGFDKEPKEVQSLSIPKIKSGADLFIISPKASGKSTAIVIGVIQQLKMAFEEAPRALIMTATKEKAFELEEQFKLLGKYTDLRSFVVFDSGRIQYQKDIIYEGIDVLIGTPKRLIELMNISGFPMTKIKTFVVDDADTLLINGANHAILRIADSIEKSQFILFAKSWIDKLKTISDRIMKNPIIIRTK